MGTSLVVWEWKWKTESTTTINSAAQPRFHELSPLTGVAVILCSRQRGRFHSYRKLGAKILAGGLYCFYKFLLTTPVAPVHGVDWGWWLRSGGRQSKTGGAGACKTHTHTFTGRCLAVLPFPDGRWPMRWPHLSTSRRPQQSERGPCTDPATTGSLWLPTIVLRLVVRLDRADAADLW